MGITLDDVILNELLSESIIEALPNDGHCWCGARLEFTDSLTQVYCPDRFCYLKVAARLEAMAKEMKADGWGESTCREVVRHFGMSSPYQVFLLEKGNNRYWDGVPAFEKKVNSICDASKRCIKLWEVVKYGGIPSISTIAFKIFDGYDCIDDAFTDIEEYQVPFIAEKIGIKNADSGVMAVNIYNTLLEYKDELRFGERQFTLVKDTGTKLQIAITGKVYGYANKSEYIRYLNNKFAGKVSITLMNSVSSGIDVLISDNNLYSDKFKTAQRLNENAKAKAIKSGATSWHEIKIMTSDEYEDYLTGIFSNDTGDVVD